MPTVAICMPGTRTEMKRLEKTVKVEAGVGIEPAYTDLQSAAWPLCHPAVPQQSSPSDR